MRVNGARAEAGPWLTYSVVALVAFLVFLPWIRGYFLGDDWMLLARNTGQPLPELLRRISDASNSRWYRPLSELSLGLSWFLFGLNPVGHHILNCVLHALNAVLVVVIGLRLTRDTRVGLLSGLTFAVLACHTEAVVWITARHEILASGFALLGMISYIKFRDNGGRMWWVGALLFYTVSLGFKETTLALPLFLALYDLIFFFPSHGDVRQWRSSARKWIPWLLLLTLGVAYALFRLQVGGGYVVPFNVLTLSKNLAYYLLMETVAFPVSTYFLSRFPLVSLPVIVSLTIACALIAWLARDQIMRNRAVWFGVLWMVLALAPVILMVAERTTYFSSVGWAWVVAIGVILAWDTSKQRHFLPERWLTALAIAGILGTNLVMATHRSYWRNRAADVSRNLFSQVRASLVSLPPGKGSQMWFVNLPYHIEYADAFGDRFLFATWLLQNQLGTDVEVVLLQDTKTNESPLDDMRQLLAARAVRDPVVAFYWQGENIVKLSTVAGVPR